MNETTDKILGFLENPKREGAWDVRGLVVGSVQSGKTSNFIGLINKAVDAGYKGIIILSGLHNNLRKQTQDRIDDGFLVMIPVCMMILILWCKSTRWLSKKNEP